MDCAEQKIKADHHPLLIPDIPDSKLFHHFMGSQAAKTTHPGCSQSSVLWVKGLYFSEVYPINRDICMAAATIFWAYSVNVARSGCLAVVQAMLVAAKASPV
jgi:hypothetical protein